MRAQPLLLLPALLLATPRPAAAWDAFNDTRLALALDRDKLSDLLGVLTPASAMGDALLTRLPAAGVRLDVERLA